MSRHPTQSNESNHHKVSFSSPSPLHHFIIEILNFTVYVAIATQILTTHFLLKVTWCIRKYVILVSELSFYENITFLMYVVGLSFVQALVNFGSEVYTFYTRASKQTSDTRVTSYSV